MVVTCINKYINVYSQLITYFFAHVVVDIKERIKILLVGLAEFSHSRSRFWILDRLGWNSVQIFFLIYRVGWDSRPNFVLIHCLGRDLGRYKILIKIPNLMKYGFSEIYD